MAAPRPAIQIEIPVAAEPVKSLHEAVASLNLSEVRKAVAILADKHGLLETQDELQRTPLVVAAKRGDASIVSYLLYLGANPDVEAKFGITPAGWAAHNAHFAAEQKDSFTGHPLSWAIRNNHFHVARILLSHRSTHEAFHAERQALDIFGESVLHACARSGNARMMRMLLAFDTWDLKQRDAAGHTVLDLADTQAIRSVVEEAAAAAKTPARSDDIFEAIASQNFRAMCACIDANPACLNARNAEQETPLIVVCKAGAGTVVAFLLARGADPTPKDSFGYAALHWAAINDHIETVRILLSHATVSAPFTDATYAVSVNGDTVVHLAARTGNVALVRFLLSFDRFLPALGVANNQRQLPKDCAEGSAVHDLCREAKAALDRGTVDYPTLSPSLMTPMAQRFPRLCAKCLSPPEEASHKAAYSCSCLAAVCDRCLSDSVVSASRSGRYPTCVNAGCKHRLPLHVVSSRLPPDAQLALVAILVNEQFAIDATYQTTCRVCSRNNSLQAVFASQTPQFACAHCSVFLCAVCNNIFPPTAEDEEIHAECKAKLPHLQLFNEYNVRVARAAEGSPTLSDADVEAIAAVDARVSAAAAGPARAAAAAAIVATLRTRYAILTFAANSGTARFCTMVRAMDIADSVNATYFAEDPCSWSVGAPLPNWLSPEPEEVWDLYGDAARAAAWVGVLPAHVPDIAAMKRAAAETE